MQRPLRMPGDALGHGSAERSPFRGSDVLVLPLQLVLALFFLCVGVWDSVHEALLTWGDRDEAS